MDFHGMKRKQLQILCKKHGIPANLKNVDIADRLASILKEIEKPEDGEQCSMADLDKIDSVIDPMDLPLRVKKVTFSPENEIFVFISSDNESTVIKKRPARSKNKKNPRNSNMVTDKSEETENSVRNARAQSVANTRRGAIAGREAGISKAAGEIDDHSDKSIASIRRLRSGGAAVVKEKKEVGQRKSREKSKSALVENKLESFGRVTRSRAQSMEKALVTNESNANAKVQVESGAGSVFQLGEPPQGLARRTRNSFASYKGLDTVSVPDEVASRKSILKSSNNKEKVAPSLMDERVNEGAEKRNARKRSSGLGTKEGSTECGLGFDSVSNQPLLRRSRRKSVTSQFLNENEFLVERLAYSARLEKPIAKEATSVNQNEPKRKPKKSYVVLSKKGSKAPKKMQKEGSRIAGTTDLKLDVSVSEMDRREEVIDGIEQKRSQIKARDGNEDTSIYTDAQNAEEENVAFESDKSVVPEYTQTNILPSEEYEKEELLLDISIDSLNEVGDLLKDNPTEVSDVVCHELAIPMDTPSEKSSCSFIVEGGSGIRPNIQEQEILREVIT